jgi:TolA-binding protein
MDFDPIKQLQSLLEDRGKVLEKISSIHSALGSFTSAEAAAPEPPQVEAAPVQSASRFSQDPVHGRLLQALGDMQAQIEQRVRPIAQQVVELEVARLRDQSDHDQAALKQCLARIDQCILTCVERLDEYQKKHALLITLNERLASLGASPEALPEQLIPMNLGDAVRLRLEALGQSRRA